MVNIDVIDGPFHGYYTMIMVIINISKQYMDMIIINVN
jgi:hypothetical protein